LHHLKWRAMEFVLKFMCCGRDKELFERLEFIDGVDDLVEFMFEVMAAAVCLLSDSRNPYPDSVYCRTNYSWTASSSSARKSFWPIRHFTTHVTSSPWQPISPPRNSSIAYNHSSQPTWNYSCNHTC
jgi:hypothetical protein